MAVCGIPGVVVVVVVVVVAVTVDTDVAVVVTNAVDVVLQDAGHAERQILVKGRQGVPRICGMRNRHTNRWCWYWCWIGGGASQYNGNSLLL